MESKVEVLEQQKQDLKGEVGHLKEKMTQMFQILAQTNAVVTTLANQNDVGYAQVSYTTGPLPRNVMDPPYGMLQGWNTEHPVDEEQEQQNKANNGPMFSANSGAGPDPKDDSGAQYQTSGNTPPLVVYRRASQSKEKWQSLEERLRAIEGGDKYGLEAVDLCLVSDVGLLIDFTTPEFDKYKDSLTGAALNWYVSLERGGIKTWRDLAEAFLKQYKYNEHMGTRSITA
ncbi:hypothetical protein CR513_18908, partial [Mucuna pruriens]